MGHRTGLVYFVKSNDGFTDTYHHKYVPASRRTMKTKKVVFVTTTQLHHSAEMFSGMPT